MKEKFKEISFTEKFDIPSATAQQRRFSRRGNYASVGLKRAAATWQAIVEKYAPEEPANVPVKVCIGLYYKVRRLSKGMEIEPKRTRPDLDNLAKVILDAMTRAGYWTDDALVSELKIYKNCITNTGGIYVNVREDNGLKWRDL